jgi:hypothetical protein
VELFLTFRRVLPFSEAPVLTLPGNARDVRRAAGNRAEKVGVEKSMR